ncbi:unknown protein [Seminavis robusta]|uniref:Glycosyltransferase 61 catalytic domain-containing protein n=1 Tax=Seminavis robusta TaxID=568900 RepID=A0A9N8I166_9STRA|nr:unknown protein [Seminavis robusta]|eukprot:Sro3189_g344910.1 n/a (452) ;mRNA; r:1447-2802
MLQFALGSSSHRRDTSVVADYIPKDRVVSIFPSNHPHAQQHTMERDERNRQLLFEERAQALARAHAHDLEDGLLQEGIYPRASSLPDLFRGPAAPYLQKRHNNNTTHNSTGEFQLVFPAANQSHAICKWVISPFGKHFPHASQELIRCVSWWQANPHQAPVLYIEDREPVSHRPAFVKTLIRVFQKAFGVQVVHTLRGFSAIGSDKYVFCDINMRKDPKQPNDVTRLSFEVYKPEDAAILRNETLKLLPENYDNAKQPNPNPEAQKAGCPADSTSRLPVIGFLNREGSRHVENHNEIVQALNTTSSWQNREQPLVHYRSSFDGLNFWGQVDFMSKVDILIGPHGAQFTGLPFLPACGGLMELFPMGYYTPKYFGTLAMATGHYHMSLYTGNTNMTEEVAHYMATYEGRSKARGFHITANAGLVLEGVLQLVERWQTCCERKLQGGSAESLF